MNAITQNRRGPALAGLLAVLCLSTPTAFAQDDDRDDKRNPKVTVSLAAPGGLHVAPAAVTLSADAQAKQKNHPIVRVEFYQGSALVGTATSAPYRATWTNAPAGNYTLTAKAINDKGDTATSAPVAFAVDAPPTVAITAPADATRVIGPRNLLLAANAADADGTIAKVEFYQGATLIGTATAAPYSVAWNNVPPGSYTLTAQATDDRGAQTVSLPIALTVVPNQAPTVSLTSPGAGQKVTAPASLALAVNAADVDGSITQVAYFQNGNPVGTATTAPFGYTWSNVPQGTYTLTATATDDFGAQTTSTAVTVTVNAAGPALGIYFIHSDHLGTPRLISDAQQNPVWRWDNTEPFGNNPPNEDPASSGTPFAFNLRFPGQYADRETNLHYNYFRDYDPATGRYVQSDPIGLRGGTNTYGYVEGNPVSNTDPTGEFAIAIPGLPALGQIASAITGIVSGTMLAQSFQKQEAKGATAVNGPNAGSGKYYCQVRANVYPIGSCSNCPQITYGHGWGSNADEAWNNALASVNQGVPQGCGYRHPHGVGGSCKGRIGGKAQ